MIRKGAWWALALVGCGVAPGGADGAAVADAGPVTITLGTGMTRFEPIGDSIELVFGPQGGWHLDLTARIQAESVDGMLLSYGVELDGRSIEYPAESALNARRVLREPDAWVRVGDRAVLDIAAADEVLDREVTVTATLRHPDHEPAADRRSVRVVDEER